MQRALLGGRDRRVGRVAVVDRPGREAHAAEVGAERLDGGVDHDARERRAVELGPERLADPVDRAVEPLVPRGQLVEPPDGVLDAPGAIGGERGEQREEREHEEEAVGVRATGDRDQQADGRQARVDQVDGADHAQLDDRGDAAPEPFPGRRDQQVAGALGDQRHRQHGPVGDVGRRRAGRREHEARGDRVERVGGAREHPLGVRAAAEDVEQLGGDQAGRDARGDRGRREQEQHRHEHQLRRHRGARADVQPHPRRDRHARDQGERDAEIEVARRRQQQRHGRRHGNEGRGRDGLDAQLAAGQCPRVIRAPSLEQPLHSRLAHAVCIDPLDQDLNGRTSDP